ncbi:hypothetical protein PMAYCL1PPCAC_18214, partial [Pristionchus mayeri]
MGGSFTARFCRDHIGHACEPSKIPLSSKDRSVLYSIIDQRYEVPRIRELLREFGRKSPLYYFSTRMIKELKSRRQEREWKMHSDDHYSEIIKVHPRFDPAYFMSDAAPALYNGFHRALPNAKAVRLYCIWHFLKFVREHVTISYIGTERERGEEVYATIKELTVTVPRKQFTHLLTTLMDSLDDKEGDGFKAYFHPHARDRTLWAPYARSTAPFNTSMFNEAYHRVLKNVWLPKGRRARLDELVNTLLTVPQIQDEDLEIEDEKGLVTGKYRLSAQYLRHRTCKEEYETATDKISIISKSEWRVQSSRGGKEYTVIDLGEGVCDCEKQNLHCWKCVACPRRFTCTCPDSVKAGLNCKHVHSALTYSPITDDTPEAGPTFMDQVLEAIDHDHAIQPRILIEEEEEDENEARLNTMVDPMEQEARREEEKKREQIGVMRGQFYELLEDARNRFNFASRKTDNTEGMEEFIKNFQSVVDQLPIPHGRRGR